MHHDAAQHDQPGHQNRIVSSLFRANESRQTDCACRAGNVLNRRSSNDAGSLEHLLHHACGLIPATAGCSGSDQTKLVELWLLGSGDAAR